MSMSYNESIIESWFHRFRGVNGFIVSCVSWFHTFHGVKVSWFHRFRGVNSFMVS